MRRIVGVYALFTDLPIWAIAAIFLTLLFLIPIGRDIFEGIPYNVSYASSVGDMALMVVVLIAATILQRGGIGGIPWWLQSKVFQSTIYFLCVGFCTVVDIKTIESRHGQLMDRYHDVVISPIFLFLAITLLWPVIVRSGTPFEKWMVFGFVSLWAILGVFDFVYHRLDQRPWLVNHIHAIEQMRR